MKDGKCKKVSGKMKINEKLDGKWNIWKEN